MNEKLDIVAIKTDNGRYYLALKKSVGNSYSSSGLFNYLINGETPKKTFDQGWVYVESEPKRISKMEPQKNTNYRYELQDKGLISEKIPEFINREDVATYDDNEYCWVWNEEMNQYRSLYKDVFDSHPDKEIEVEFTLEVILSVKDIIDPVKMSYQVSKSRWKSDGLKELTEKDVKYQLIDKIIFPSIVLPQRSCKFTSEQTYEIIRNYVKDNLDASVATIDSDYDFCFNVKKRIKLAEVKKYKIDINNNIFSKRKKKPKYVDKQQVEKLETCFEMTPASKAYKGYTPIQGFEAKTQKELKKKIDIYCEELIDFINTPLAECNHCNGNGVIVTDKKETNERQG